MQKVNNKALTCMRKIFPFLMTLILLGAGCVSNISSSSPAYKTINGVVELGRFGGTERGCEFGEKAMVGDRIECNIGSVNLAVITTGGQRIWLDGYTCDAVEYFTKEMDGQRVDYETTNCNSDIIVGNRYTFTGALEERKDQWYMGVRQDELWLVDVIAK